MKLLTTALTFFMAFSLTYSLSGAERDLIISAYQGDTNDGNFDANLRTVYRVIQEALDRQSDFLCFPETFLSGYGTRELVEQGAVTLDDKRIAQLIKSTAAHEMVVLVGAALKTEEGIYNSMLVMYKGELLGTYSKIMLTRGDWYTMGFTRGDSMPVFEAKGVKFACIICNDSSSPETALMAKLQGAAILFSPHWNAIGTERMDEHRIRVRNNHIGIAALTRMIVVRANITTVRSGRLGYGDSAIFDNTGTSIAQAPLFQEALITAHIPPDMLRISETWNRHLQIPFNIREKLAELYLSY